MAGTAATGVGPGTGNEQDLQMKSMTLGLDGSVAVRSLESGHWGYASLSASGNTLVKTGAGQLNSIICGTATGNITIYDGTSSGGTVILATSALVVGKTTFNISFATGLFIVLSGAGVATAVYS